MTGSALQSLDIVYIVASGREVGYREGVRGREGQKFHRMGGRRIFLRGFFAVFFDVVSSIPLRPLFGLNFFIFLSWSQILTSFWRPLGILLGPFWETFGAFWGTSWEHAWQVVLTSIFDAFSMRLNIEFWFSSRRKCNFDIFVRVDVGIDFGFQNLPKMDPKRSQDGPKRMPKGSQTVF